MMSYSPIFLSLLAFCLSYSRLSLHHLFFSSHLSFSFSPFSLSLCPPVQTGERISGKGNGVGWERECENALPCRPAGCPAEDECVCVCVCVCVCSSEGSLSCVCVC